MKKFFFLSFLFISTCIYAQKEANFWYFGNNAGIDFSSGNPVSLNNGKLKTDEGCSSISDENGNLLFYSDGIRVWTKNHELMKYSNGNLANNLKGNPSSTQSGLIVPNPENKNLYYIFTVGTDFIGDSNVLPNNPGFNFYTIDISKGNGGEIISGPVNLANGKDLEWSEKVTAVQGKDCKEIWVLSIVENTFYAYKIDKNGVQNSTPVISTITYTLKDKRGYLKVSPDGTKIAVADYNAGFNTQSNSFDLGSSQLILVDFNTTTGKVSGGSYLLNPQTDGAPYGVEFSQQSSKLYTSTHDGTFNKVFQFDITAQNITSSKTLVNKRVGFRGALQLASNGKIYATVPKRYSEGNTSLDVIENPDDIAKDIKYSENKVSLGGKTSTQGLPPFIQSFFAPVNVINTATNTVLNQTNQVLCIGENYTIKAQRNDTNATYTWSVNGKEVAKTETLTIDNTNYGSGLYEIKVEPADDCKKAYTGRVNISFNPKPTIKVIPTYIQCDFDGNTTDGFTTFNLASKESELVSDPTKFTIDFFETTDTNFNNPLNKNNYTNRVARNHSVTARVTYKKTNCFQTRVINLKVNPTGLSTYKDEYICEIDENASNPKAKFSKGTNKGFYDFSKKTQQIIANSGGAFSENTHNFQYYRTTQDASLQTNEIVAPYEDVLITNNSDIFVRISNKGINACETVGKFKLFVEKLPAPQGDLNIKTLCVSNPKLVPQPNTIELNADTGNPTDTYKWYVDGNLISGASSAIYNANKAGEYKVEAYKNTSSSNTSCAGYNTFYVKESNKAHIVGVRSKGNQDDPTKNRIMIKVEGIGDYEYAINSTDISDFKKGSENLTFTFTDLEPGLNKIYIRDRNGCGITSPEEISIIYFQRHFSPNEDGILDTWNVLGTNNDFFEVVKIDIFDRFGKLLKQMKNKNNVGWDGVYKGKLLPSSDYWYNAELIDKNGKVIKRTGHFSLLRK